MDQSFPRLYVEKLRVKADRYRFRNKVLVQALIKQECLLQGVDFNGLSDEDREAIRIDDHGKVLGMPDALSPKSQDK